MGKFRRKDREHQQGEFWLPAAKLATGPKDSFFARLQKVLDGMDFTGRIHRICEPYYDAGIGKAGRPPIDPAVFFKMMMVGFLEGIPSDRGIAARCSDSLTLRRFLGYSLTEETPDHSSFTAIRQRLPYEAFAAAHEVVLDGLRAHGLLKGRNLGMDSSDMEANASLSGLVKRNTEESYCDYVRGLARAAGVDADDPAAVARFDRRREGRKTSNAEWYNPSDPDAKVGRTKHGACDMLHKPEHIVDLDSGAIVAAEVRPGDAADSADLSARVMEAAEVVEDLHGQAPAEGASRVKTLTTDKGFHDPAELAILQHELGVRTIIGDAHAPRRRLDRLEPQARAAVVRAARAVASPSGKALLKKRGEMIERSFAHVLDSGGPAAHHPAGPGQHQQTVSVRHHWIQPWAHPAETDRSGHPAAGRRRQSGIFGPWALALAGSGNPLAAGGRSPAALAGNFSSRSQGSLTFFNQSPSRQNGLNSTGS